MADPIMPPRAKLFIGILAADEKLIYQAETILVQKYGIIDARTAPIPFSHTNYYRTMGPILYKVFYSFDKLIKREKISDIKLYTNKIETKLSPKAKRIINIDPGYLTLSNVFLASCKEYFHRAYVGKGIYLENEYKYVDRRYQTWEWTYPDYKKSEYMEFFYRIRKVYHTQIKDEL